MDAFRDYIQYIFTHFSAEGFQTAYASYSPYFNTEGTIMFIVFVVILALLAISLVLLIIWGLKKIIKKKNKEGYDEAKLLEEIERLNLELYDVTREKDRILSLTREADGVYSPVVNGLPSGVGGGNRVDNSQSPAAGRFAKLYVVDEKYKEGDFVTELPEEAQAISLKDICERFRNFACSQMRLYYTPEVVRQFFAAMGTGHLIILEGISGTGKTSLATAMGKFFSFDSALIPVQPSWKDRSELIGYYNEFTKKFNESEFLRALYVATYRKDLDVIVLDEMNLARIEYYFAEFLSVMEMKEKENWVIDLIPTSEKNDPKNLVEGKLNIPQNVIFFGTANNDDSTFTISDKVYDRAISLFFDDKGRPFDCVETEPISIPYAQLVSLFVEAKKQNHISSELLNKFEELDNYVIKNFRLAFGNRILKQLEDFIPTFVACGGKEVDGFDFIFANKILKKFEALNLAYLKDNLKALQVYLEKSFGKGNFQMSQSYIEGLIKNN